MGIFTLNPDKVYIQILTLARGEHPDPWQAGVGVKTRVGSATLLYQRQGDPWLGLMDLAGAPLPDRYVQLLVRWFRSLRGELAAHGLYLARPRVSGFRLVPDLEEFQSQAPERWPSSSTPVSYLVPNWRSLGGDSQIRFRDIKQLDRLRLNHHDQSYRAWAHSFSGETALLLARLSQEEERAEVEAGFSHDQRLIFPEALKMARYKFMLDLLGEFDLQEYFPAAAHLLRKIADDSERLQFFAQVVATGFDAPDYRPQYNRAMENSWQGANYMGEEKAYIVPDNFADDLSVADPYIREEEIDHLYRAEQRYYRYLAMRTS
ncbi:hypothetical protein HYV70_03755 [Candidatus Uhrbacteria bacterium]|nr:hypothetical protein [Candidatus Uhrbacteria bacterium]